MTLLKPTGTVIGAKPANAKLVRAEAPKISELKVIDNNVPLPSKRGGRQRSEYYVELEATLKQLKPGQSIKSTANPATVLHVVADVKKATKWKFATRQLTDDEQKYVRIWRMA